MTASTSDIGTRRGERTAHLVRRVAIAAGSLVAGIGSRWSAFVEAGQLGPDPERSISRHTGGRI
jgi:hypothetical protein